MLTTLGVLFYSVVFIALLYLGIRKKQASLSVTEITLAFGFKVLMGCLYGYIFLRYYGGDDTWAYHQESLERYEELFRDPGLFFGSFSPVPAFENSNSFSEGFSLYLMTLERQLFFKTLALFNFFSRGNYYINVVFFNFIVFWGHYWLFSLLQNHFADKRRWLYILIFLFPPVIFWLSGIRADGLLLFFIALSLLHFHKWLHQHKTRSLLIVLLALAGIFIFRNAMVMLLLPALIAWALSVKLNWKPVRTFIITWVLATVLFFASAWISPNNNLPQVVANRQQEFFSLKANTRLPLDSLTSSAGSYVRIAPQAVQNTFLRPWLWEAKGFLQIISALDICLFWFLVIIMLIKRDPRWKETMSNPIILALLFFSISLYLFIGYSIPFPGAIVRYKIIPELFLLTTVILNINRAYDNRITKKLHI